MITQRTDKAMFITNTFLTTYTTILRGIMRVNIDNRDANFKGFICNKVLELIERPRMYKEFLFSLNLNSISYIFKVFHNDNITSIATIDNSLADAMVSIGHPTFFSNRKLFQSAFSRFCAFGLKALTNIRIMFSSLHNLFTLSLIHI